MSDIANSIVEYWLYEVGPQNWYQGTAEIDKEIKSKFEPYFQQAANKELCAWMCTPESALALTLLLDQFPRFMYRGTEKAYRTDRMALAIAKRAIVMGHDLKTAEPQRQFFYVPLMHSESLMDQERCVRLMTLRMPRLGDEGLCHAKAHRDIIRQFGRFPYRNEVVARDTTEREKAFLVAGGYELAMNAHAA